MEPENKANYQTYILFFSWTVGLIAVMIRMFVKIELTPMILTIALIDILYTFSQKKVKPNRFVYHASTILFIFYGWLIFTNAYSPSLSYKYSKTFYFIANIIFFLYPFFIKKIKFDLLIRLYCIIVLPLSIYFVYMNSILWKVKSSSTELFMGIRDAYLVVGIQLGILFLLLLYFKKNIFLKVLTLFLLVASSARGPLVFLLLLILLYLLVEHKIKLFNPKTIFRSIVVFAGISILYYFVNATKLDNLLGNTFRRFGSLAGGEDASALERVSRLKFAFYQPFENITTLFFGNGIGSFGVLYNKIDQRSYPHNIFAECFFELGLIGLVLFLILFSTIFRKISLKNHIFGLLFLFAFLNAMKSSNITDLWILFSFMGGIAATNTRLFESKNNVDAHKN